MVEGWLEDDYLILFSPEESVAAAERYSFGEYLPGFSPVGLRGWDDFLVTDAKGSISALPTVPIDQALAAEFILPAQLPLVPDERFKGRIKWYVKPLIVGGDAQAAENMTWVTHDQHAELVVWWNRYLRSLQGEAG